MQFEILLICAVFLGGISQAADSAPQPITVVDQYNGGFKDIYPRELNAVRSYLGTVQVDIASSLGLQYGQGFRHPVQLRFDDGVPSANENPYFYVRSSGTGEGYAQEIVANVEAYARPPSTGNTPITTVSEGFRYAMTQVMLNDVTAGSASAAFPLWVQEGLCVYASGSGDRLVQEVAQRVRVAHVGDLVANLNNPSPYLTPVDSARYYLAIRFLASKGSIGTFINMLINGDSVPDAVRNLTGQEWGEFQALYKQFAVTEFGRSAQPDEDEDEDTPRSTARPRYLIRK